MAKKDLPPLRIGDLSQMAKSPFHCRYAIDNPSVPTATMRLGSMAHAIMLGKAMPAVYPGPVRRGKEFEAFKAQYPEGETIYIESEVAEARKIARSLMDHKEACRLLMGRREETILWEFSGRLCRGTPDAFNTNESELVDLKTTVCAEARRFQWQALSLAYHAKLAWYQDGLEAAGIGLLERCALIAVENSPPYAVTTYQLTANALEFGRKLYRSWLEFYLACEKSNTWPSYPAGQLDAPEEGLELTIAGEAVEVA